MKLSCSVKLLRPGEVVFPWIAEPQKAAKWQKDVKHYTILSSTPEVVGTTFTETIEQGGSELQMHGTITDYQKNRRISFHLQSRVHDFDVTYSLAGVGDHTAVSIDALVKWKFPMNIISILIGTNIQLRLTRQLASELTELKRLCELD